MNEQTTETLGLVQPLILVSFFSLPLIPAVPAAELIAERNSPANPSSYPVSISSHLCR
jgi:hypothetical protein